MRENAALERTFGFASDMLCDLLCDLLCELPGTLYKDLVNLYPNTCAATHKKLHTIPHF